MDPVPGSLLARRMRRLVFLTLAALVLAPLPGCTLLRRRAAQRPAYGRVSPPVAFEMLHDSPEILILDLRGPDAYNGETGHLFRAYNIPLERLPFRLLEISAYRDDTFLVYCDTATCAMEGMGILVSSGFEDAVLIEGGIDAWIRKGFGTVLPSDLAGRAAEREADARAAGRSAPRPRPAPAAPASSLDAPAGPPPP
jgi:rhodanese-related sulfurtransferase